jgi:hypothetical protein
MIGSDKNKKVALALMGNPTIAKAAQELQMSEISLYRLRKNPKFQIEYQQVSNQIYTCIIDKMKSASIAAIDTLHNIILDINSKPCSKIQASKVILETLFKMSDIDVSKRIENLERLIDQQIIDDDTIGVDDV